MTVPETPMYENHNAPSRKNQIRASGETGCVQAEPEPSTMKVGSHFPFRYSIATSNSRHHAAPGSPIHDVRHYQAASRDKSC